MGFNSAFKGLRCSGTRGDVRSCGIWHRITGWLEPDVARERCGFIFKDHNGTDSSCTFLLLNLRPPCCLETSGANHAVPRRHIPEERRRQLHRCGSLKTRSYSSLTSTKSPSFWMKTFNASLTNLTVLLPQSRDYSCYVSRPILAPAPLGLQKHSDLRAQDLCTLRLVISV